MTLATLSGGGTMFLVCIKPSTYFWLWPSNSCWWRTFVLRYTKLWAASIFTGDVLFWVSFKPVCLLLVWDMPLLREIMSTFGANLSLLLNSFDIWTLPVSLKPMGSVPVIFDIFELCLLPTDGGVNLPLVGGFDECLELICWFLFTLKGYSIYISLDSIAGIITSFSSGSLF